MYSDVSTPAWANILMNGAGVFVIKRAFQDLEAAAENWGQLQLD